VAHPTKAMFPTVPADASIESLILVSELLGRPAPAAPTQASNRTIFGLGNPLGFGANELSKHLFAEPLSPQEMLARHSFFHILTANTPGPQKRSALQVVMLGEFSGRRSVSLMATSIWPELIRYQVCFDCLDDDERQYGVPHWHRNHGLPGVTKCPTHGATLIAQCAHCNSPVGSPIARALPSLTCRSCNKPLSRPRAAGHPSQGESLFIRKCIALAEGAAPSLSSNRSGAHIRALHPAGHDLATVELAIWRLWDVSTWSELLARMRDSTPISNVRHFLRTGRGSASIAAKLMIVSSLESLKE
jgi:hypothetical protein